MFKKGYARAVALLLVFAWVLLQGVTVLAEGSVSLYPGDGTPPGAQPYRPYTEWYNATYVGMDRRQVIKVYAEAGETIFFGSSVHSSRFDGNGTKDIKVVDPGGDAATYDVINGGTGHINTLAKEKAGPWYTDNGAVKNSGGYRPLSILAAETGVYVFEFYSPYNTPAGNPTAKTTTALWDEGNGGTIGAWDVTVVKGVGTGSSHAVTGRTFCDYLCLNMGSNFYTGDKNRGLYAIVYVLTDDGYIYKTDFNGMDPYGFLFFANNRGLINPASNTSLYHSARATVTTMADLKVTIPGAEGNTVILPTFHLPSQPDTALDKTHKIFFEEPADDLPESLRATPYAPGSVTDFKFYGEDDNIGYVGAGGLFSFYVSSGSSYQIKIDFAENYGGTGRAANTLFLSNSCRPGYNSIFWDGRDGNGDMVPKGIYGSGSSEGSITITIEVKAGEYHFPLLDVESNPFGVKIELMNTPINADGTLYQWASPAAEAKARRTIYYDNSLIIGSGGAGWEGIDGQHCALDGIDSQNGAAKFMATTTGNQATLGGDVSFIDLWTYTVGDATSIESAIEEFELIEQDEAESAQLRGLVFFDQDSNGGFSVQEGDYPLEGARVELYDSDNELVAAVTTDINGNYYLPGLLRDMTYRVRVYSPFVFADFTTHTTGITSGPEEKYLEFSTGALDPGLNTAASVGIYYGTLNHTLQVTKKWGQTLAQDPARPGEIIVTAVGSHGGQDYLFVDGSLSNANGWNHTFYDLPARNGQGAALEYRILERGAEGYVTTVDYQVTEGGAVSLYTLTNTPRQLTICKQLAEPVLTAQHFIFSVAGDTDDVSGADITFTVLITVPASETAASLTLTHLPAGEYTVTEQTGRWRYSLDVPNTKAEKNGVRIAGPVAGALTLAINDVASYRFTFANQRQRSDWLDFSTRVTNTMKAIN